MTADALSKQAVMWVQKKDFISLLRMGWNANYNEDPQFQTVHDPRNGVDDIVEQLSAGKWGTVTARGRNKRMTQHKAAAELLLKIIDDGEHKKFLIPGRDPDEARQIIEEMSTRFGASQPESQIASDNPTTQSNQPNWVGRVNEFISKKRIPSRWRDDYTQTGQSNTIEHSCRLVLEILDGQQQNVLQKIEGSGQARNKKQAKQLAFKQILDQLIQHFGPFNQPIPQQPSPLVSSTSAKISDVQPGPNNQQPPTESNVPEQNEEPMQWEQQQQKGQEQENETDFIRLQLGTILGDRRANLMGAEQKLRRILNCNDSQVEKVFGQAELKFIDCANNESIGISQVYLEVCGGPKKQLLCTFGGQGPDRQATRDSACWQAMEFLYIFGGFTPTNSNRQ